jgi:nucleotide-binding universal stress UspA family protein
VLKLDEDPRGLEAKRTGVDLIVVEPAASIRASYVLGSVSTKAIHEASCDVVVVR